VVRAQRLSVTVDQYVDCIGNIHYREAADPNNNSFVVTGMTEYAPPCPARAVGSF